MLISMQEVRAALGLDADTIDDATLGILIFAATLHVEDFLGHAYAENARVPAAIPAAILVAVAFMIDHEHQAEPLNQNRAFVALLEPFREPEPAPARTRAAPASASSAAGRSTGTRAITSPASQVWEPAPAVRP